MAASASFRISDAARTRWKRVPPAGHHAQLVAVGPEPGGGDYVEHGVDRAARDGVMAHPRHRCSLLRWPSAVSPADHAGGRVHAAGSVPQGSLGLDGVLSTAVVGDLAVTESEEVSSDTGVNSSTSMAEPNAAKKSSTASLP